jgi:hypothetical protein
VRAYTVYCYTAPSKFGRGRGTSGPAKLCSTVPVSFSAHARPKWLPSKCRGGSATKSVHSLSIVQTWEVWPAGCTCGANIKTFLADLLALSFFMALAVPRRLAIAVSPTPVGLVTVQKTAVLQLLGTLITPHYLCCFLVCRHRKCIQPVCVAAAPLILHAGKGDPDGSYPPILYASKSDCDDLFK